MTPTEARDRACRLVFEDFTRALQAARDISDPWFGAQALAWVGRFAPEDRAVSVIRESVTLAFQAPDHYRAVAATAWPIRAFLELRHTDRIPQLVSKALDRTPNITPPSSKSEALFILLQAVIPADQSVWEPVFVSLLTASIPVEHWRQERNLCDALCLVAVRNPNLAAEAAANISDPKIKRRAERALSAAVGTVPRSFFWEPGSPAADPSWSRAT